MCDIKMLIVEAKMNELWEEGKVEDFKQVEKMRNVMRREEKKEI